MGPAALQRPEKSNDDADKLWEEYSDQFEAARRVPDVEDIVDAKGRVLTTKS